MKNNDWNNFKVGDRSSLTITFAEEEVLQFSKLCRDRNPVHFDQEYAAGTQFKERIVQGAYIAALIPGILGSDLPGPGTIYMGQTSRFLAPVFIGDTVSAFVEILSIRQDKPIIKLKTWVAKGKEIVFDGEATILFLKEDSK